MLTNIRQQNTLQGMDKSLLELFGLNEKEISIYKAVLTNSSITPLALGKVTGVKRTTAYSIARGLVEKGLLVEDTTRRPRTFVPANPEQVRALINDDKKRLAKREESLKSLANELEKLGAKKSYTVPTVRFIEESKIESFLKQRSSIWDANLVATDTTWWGFQDHTFVEHYGGWIQWYWKQAFEVIDLKLLSNRSPVELKFSAAANPEQSRRRQIKFWGEATNFLSTSWAIGDYLVMINTRTRPFYLVEIHDKLMAHDQREVFRNLWPLVP